MTTDELVALVGRDAQIIDGTVTGYREPYPGDAAVIIRAVRTSDWDVYSDDIKVVDAIRRAFHDASPIPND